MKNKKTKSEKLEQIRFEIGADKVIISRIYQGAYKAMWGYFYTYGRTAEKYAERIKQIYPDAEIIDTGDNWKPFRGGASLEKQSHFWVAFKFSI
jgi:hypothetical protein